MLPQHCKLIRALNIYYTTAGGLHGGDVREWERAEQRNVGSPSGSSLHHARHQRHVVSARFIVELIETFDDN